MIGENHAIEYTLLDNTSRVYFNGSTLNSKNYGNFTIVGKTDRYRVNSRNYKEFIYYLCKFEDGTIVEARAIEIKSGSVKNPNFPIICGVGFVGIGKWDAYIDREATKEYSLFKNIINRCYNKNEKSYERYGGIGVTLHPSLHNFQNFCEMISKLPNYHEWKKEKDGAWHLDKDFLNEKLGISPKIYSAETCQFVLAEDNMSERNKRVSVTGLTYLGTSPDGKEYEFTNISQFAREHSLYDTHIGSCVRGKQKKHKGWTFSVKSV